MCKKIFFFLWQLPQNVLGFLLSRNYEYKSESYGINIYYKNGISFLSYTLGDFTIMDYYYCGRNSDLHKTQNKYNILSKRLGWLYLFIIFIPQFFVNIVARFKTYDVYDLNIYLDKHYPNKLVNKIKVN